MTARRARALPLGRHRRSALCALPRRGVGRAQDRRPRAVREAGAGGLPGRPVVAHDPQEARELPPRLPRVRCRAHRPLRRQGHRAADGRSRHRAQPAQGRGHHRQRTRAAEAAGAHERSRRSCGASSTGARRSTRIAPSRPCRPRRRPPKPSPRRSRPKASASSGRPRSMPSCRRPAWSTITSSTCHRYEPCAELQRRFKAPVASARRA